MADVSQSTKQKGIPLCLPNNVTWNPVTGETRTTGDKRSSLYVVPAAAKRLQEIKEPVCVVSIAGPCRDGKSYILGEVFGHMDVFSIGHEMDPETVGLWMWIVPQKYKDSRDRDFTVILLDSEGISSVDTESEDDNQVFTLTVLLASMLIYNSKNVPKRRDLDDLSFIAKLSQRIRIHSKDSCRDDQEVFRNTFPFFIWLLRDVTQAIPKDCKDLNHYFSTRVFKESTTSKSRKDEAEKQMIAESILSFFSGFDSFSLPPPSDDPKVMQDISNSRDKLSSKFLDGVKRFESTLKRQLKPKRSINRGEYVTGDALGSLVQIYTDAINDPDVMPNVEKAWDSFVKIKCSEAKAKALQIYEQVMEGLMSSRLPCDGEEILKSHGEAQRKSMELFDAETAELISAVIKEELEKLTKSIDEKLVYWKDKNASLTQTSCDELLAKLKAEHLDPVLKRVRGPDGAKVCYTEIMNGWNMIKTDFNLKAVGAKDIKADVFFKFNQGLQDEVMQYEEILKKMKDYDENLSKEKIAKAYQEKEMRRMEEHIAQLKKEEKGWRKKMEMLEKKQEEELNLIKEQSAADKEAWTKQMEMMKEADMKVQVQLEKHLDTVVDKEKQSSEALLQMKKELEKSKKEAEAEKEAATQKLKDIKDESAKAVEELQQKLDSLQMDERNEFLVQIQDMWKESKEQADFLRKQVEKQRDELDEINKPGFIRRVWRKIF